MTDVTKRDEVFSIVYQHKIGCSDIIATYMYKLTETGYLLHDMYQF